MRYKPEWKGKLRVDGHGNVYWQDQHKGRVSSRHVEGAKSPGGMVTNQVWVGSRLEADAQGQFVSRETAGMTEAIEFVLALDQEEKLWIWNWHNGGYNSCKAVTREQALAIGNAMSANLHVDEKTLHVGDYKELGRLDRQYAGMFD